MGIVKHRCVCDICSCGRHHCKPVAENSIGKLDLKSQGDIFVASKASYQFPDSLNLFEGPQELTTIVNADYKGHRSMGIERRKPKDLIEIPNVKMSRNTITRSEFPDHKITAEMYGAAQSAPDSLSAPEKLIKMSTETSYSNHFPSKKGIIRDAPKIRAPEIAGPTGYLDLTTVNRKDYVGFQYGRPHLNHISDSNVFGLTDKDKVSNVTTSRDHFTGLSCTPVQVIKREDSKIELGKDSDKLNSTMRQDYVKKGPKMRSSKKRGTAIDFGRDLDHQTSYSTQFKGEGVKKEDAAKFKDELELFAGAQDLQTIVRADFTTPSKTGVERHKPKDLIEIPNEKMSSETITLGHYQAPPLAVSAETVDTNEGVGVKAVFDINTAIPTRKVDYNTSYGNEFTKKKADKAAKASFKDEIGPSQGDLDLNTLARTDYTKFKYGRPQIHSIPDNNIMGVRYELGAGRKEVTPSSLEVESLPSSRHSLRVDANDVKTKQSAPDFDIGLLQVESLPDTPESLIVSTGAVKTQQSALGGLTVETSESVPQKSKVASKRTSKRRASTLHFGKGFYSDTSYRDHFTNKQCIVPTIDKLDEYTFSTIKGGHRIYKIDCECPPKGACGCPPPIEA